MGQNTMGQNATLTPSQEIAIAALLEGHSVTDTAAAAGVTRSTVHRWMAEDFDFQAELNRQRAEFRSACRARIHRLAEHAIGTVETAIAEGDARTALAVLKSMKLLSPPRVGSTDADYLAEEHAITEMDRKRRLESDRLYASVGI